MEFLNRIANIFKGKSKSSIDRLIIGFAADSCCLLGFQQKEPERVLFYQLIELDEDTTPGNALKKVFEDNDFKKVEATIVLSPEHYRMIFLDTPKVPEAERQMASKWLVKDLIDFPISEAAIDLFSVPVRQGQPEKCYVVIARLSMLQDLLLPFEKAAITVQGVTITEIALLGMLPVLDEPVALLYSNVEGFSTMVVRQGVLENVRNVDIVPQKGVLSEKHHEALELELQRSFDFYQTQMNNPVERLFLSPVFSKMPGVLDYLKLQLSIPVEMLQEGDVFAALDDDRWFDHAAAVGEYNKKLEMSGEEADA